MVFLHKLYFIYIDLGLKRKTVIYCCFFYYRDASKTKKTIINLCRNRIYYYWYCISIFDIQTNVLVSSTCSFENFVIHTLSLKRTTKFTENLMHLYMHSNRWQL